MISRGISTAMIAVPVVALDVRGGDNANFGTKILAWFHHPSLTSPCVAHNQPIDHKLARSNQTIVGSSFESTGNPTTFSGSVLERRL